MNATELYLQDGRSAGVFFCTECKIVHRQAEHAERCCRPQVCHFCKQETGSKSRLFHDDCYRAANEVKTQEKIQAAEKLSDWDGWVYWDGWGYNEGFFDSIGALIEYATDEELGLPPFVFACNTVPFPGADISDILERVCEELPEDYIDRLKGTAELKAALDAFHDANKELYSYKPDYKRAVSTAVVMQA